MAVTITVVIAIVRIPESNLEQKVQPIKLDAAILEQRLTNKITRYSPVMGLQDGMLTDNLRQDASLTRSDKKFGYRVKQGSTQAIGNRDFFEAALPLSPSLYHRFDSTRKMKLDGRDVTVEVTQVYPKKYET